MDQVAGIAFKQAPCFSSSAGDASNVGRFHYFPTKKQSSAFFPAQQVNRKPVVFSDKSHLQYYNGPRMEIKEKEIASKKKEVKKKLKLIKGLSKKLSDFSEMGFGLNPEHGLDYQVKGQMISEATEILLGQLQKLKAEKLESKMKKKEEKAKKKGAGMDLESCSSSSSSESECEKVVSRRPLERIAAPPKEEASSSGSCVEGVVEENRGMVGVDKKIEVCMGGKCKKSGGAMLLESLGKAVGGEGGVVVGCKCMGKCRDGPNVRVAGNGNDGICMGVGVEDIDSIVNRFIGGIRGQPSPSPSPAPALSGF